jgi:hypothetical protein
MSCGSVGLREGISALGINPRRTAGDAELTEFLPASLGYSAEVYKISAHAQAHVAMSCHR